ncbi:MAG: aminoacyl-tRNA hydrolase [Candidatus Saccharicenans sp.]|nr:aminoacyl-tRNA hydrolase [Candidatus Saccharicenans sp.]
MWLVVGLGNPGSRYHYTRHNAGFLAVQSIAKAWHLQSWTRSSNSKIIKTKKGSKGVILAQPLTFMNLSGLAVRDLMSHYKIKPDNLIVIYDDLDLDLGEIRVRAQGSPGTHKGMQSIIQAIGTQSFPRVRIGIGPKPDQQDASQYVLSEFGEEEKEKLGRVLEKTQRAVEMTIAGRLPAAMNVFNSRRKAPLSEEG